jgi:predicted porin
VVRSFRARPFSLQKRPRTAVAHQARQPIARVAPSSVTNGYQTASAQNRFAVTAGYATTSDLDLSASYSNVQYRPGTGSSFKSTAVWNTFGAVVHVRVATVWNFAAGYSYTRASKANGITDGAQYQQASLSEFYSLSKRTGLYMVQAYQRAGGQTLGSNGVSIISATPTIGDGFNSTPSSSRSMAAVAAGVFTASDDCPAAAEFATR